MKYRFLRSILAILIITFFININSTQLIFCAEQNEEETNKSVTPEDLFSLLFPQRNQLYPVFISGITGPTRTINALSDPSDQFTQRKYINEYYRTRIKYLFPHITVPENVGMIYLPTEMRIKGGGTVWKCLFSFFHEDVNITVVFFGVATSITFEYEENAQTPESLEAVCQKLSKFIPWMENLIFSYDLPENQKIYQGNGLDETKLYHVKARQGIVMSDGANTNIVRWWRGPGRFGISSSGGTSWFMPGQTILLHATPDGFL